MRPSSETIRGLGLDPEPFEPQSVPGATLAVTDRLRRRGAVAPALTAAEIEELRNAPPGEAGVLAVEPPSDLAVDRMIDTGLGKIGDSACRSQPVVSIRRRRE